MFAFKMGGIALTAFALVTYVGFTEFWGSRQGVLLRSDEAPCRDPDLGRVAKGATLTLCDGSLAEGTMTIESVTAEDIVEGMTYFNIVGSLSPQLPQCSSRESECTILENAFAVERVRPAFDV